jgi:hypothetical protein
MDIEWLKQNSFPTRVQMRRRFANIDLMSFDGRDDWFMTVAGMCSDLAPGSRDHYWKELAAYGKRKVYADLESIHNMLHDKIAEYPNLPMIPTVAADKIMDELGYLVELEVSIHFFHGEVRWVLGQILGAFPNIREQYDPLSMQLEGEYAVLNEPYGMVESIIKTLGDPCVRNYYDRNHPGAYMKHVSDMLQAHDRTEQGKMLDNGRSGFMIAPCTEIEDKGDHDHNTHETSDPQES